MYKKLHRRLTLLFTGITGILLIAMSVSYLYMSEKDLRQNTFLTFSSQVTSLLASLEQQASLTWEWISKTSANQSLILALYDNDMPIAYNRIVLSEQEIALADEALSYGRQNYPTLGSGSSYSASHQEFTWTSGSGAPCFVSMFNIRKSSGILSGAILSSRLPLLRQIRAQRLRFLFLNIAGIVILLLFSWYYTGKLLKPIMESRKKQA